MGVTLGRLIRGLSSSIDPRLTPPCVSLTRTSSCEKRRADDVRAIPGVPQTRFGLAGELAPPHYLRPAPVAIFSAVAIVYVVDVFYRAAEDTTAITNAAFGVSATLAALSFGAARAVGEKADDRDLFLFAGERFFHTALVVILGSIVKYASIPGGVLDPVFTFLGLSDSASAGARRVLGMLVGVIFLGSLHYAVAGFTILTHLLWRRETRVVVNPSLVRNEKPHVWGHHTMDPLQRVREAFIQLEFAIKLRAHVELGEVEAESFDTEIEEVYEAGRVRFADGHFRDPHELWRAAENNVHIALGFTATAMDRALAQAGVPLNPEDRSNRGQIRTLVYMLRCAYAHDMIHPVWECRGLYRQQLQVRVKDFSIALNLEEFDGRPLELSQLGELHTYLALKDEVVAHLKALAQVPSP